MKNWFHMGILCLFFWGGINTATAQSTDRLVVLQTLLDSMTTEIPALEERTSLSLRYKD